MKKRKKLKRLIFHVLIITVLSSCSSKNYRIIQNVNVFDGLQIHEDVNFVFSDSIIIGITSRKNKYKATEVIDGRGMTILPPLINAHVHVRSPQNLKDGLNNGIFAILDMFTTDNRANYLRAYNDSLNYSSYYSSNIGATAPGGHGTQYGVKIPTIDSTLSGRQFVNERIAQKADYIKITQEQSMSKLNKDQIKEVIQTAKNQKRKIIGHISGIEDAKDLVHGGISGLAHIWYRKESISSRKDLELMSEKEIFIIPTLSVIEKVVENAKENGVSERYLTFELVKNEVRKANEAGIKILAGTDAPNYNMNYTTQLYEELTLLKQCGLTNMELLKSATTSIYEKFELNEFKGLKRKELASFILIKGKPYENIEELKNEKRIWKKGIEILGS